MAETDKRNVGTNGNEEKKLQKESKKQKKQQPKQQNKDPITYQNKDVGSKVLAEHLPGKDLSVLGVKLARIKSLEPTNLPAVEANELKLDNLLLLEDDSYLIVDYESVYREANKSKYLNYIARLTKRLYNDKKRYPKIRILVIYTGDVEEGTTQHVLDIAGLRMEVLEVFLIGMDGETILRETDRKLEAGEMLSDEELLRFIISPLTFKGEAGKVEATHRAIGIADKISDEETERFVLQMLKVITNRFIKEEDAKRIREVIRMTKVDRIIEREKQEAIKEAIEKNTDDVSQRIAANLLKKGMCEDDVSSCTGLPLSDVQKLAAAEL